MMATLKVRGKIAMERVDALSLRERALLFVGVMAILYIVAMNILFSPLLAEQDRLNGLLKGKNEQIQSMNHQIQAMLGSPDGAAPEQQQLATLTAQVKDLDAQLERIVGGMVSPQQMAKLLEQVLGKHQGVRLVRIENLPKSLVVGDAASSGNKGPALYRHGLKLQIKGRYFDIVNYLKALETLPWRVYWGEVTLNAEKHPVSEATLVIYTLSRQPGWIGV